MKYVMKCDVCGMEFVYESATLRLKPGAKAMIMNPDCPHSWFTVQSVGLTKRATAGTGKKAVDKEVGKACAGLGIRTIAFSGHKIMLGSYTHHRRGPDEVSLVGGDTAEEVRSEIQKHVLGHIGSVHGFGAKVGKTTFWCETVYYETDPDLHEIVMLGKEIGKEVSEDTAKKYASKYTRRQVFVSGDGAAEREYTYWDRENRHYLARGI